MVHYTTSDDKYRGSPYGNESDPHPPCYRFGRSWEKSGRGRSAVHRANGYLKSLIQSIADAKLRRMRRELELRGIQIDGPDEEWIPSSLRKGKGAK
jgi:hypothetical protein